MSSLSFLELAHLGILASFPLSTLLPAANAALLRNVGIAALELLSLAVGSCALGSLTSCLWISTGERNIMALRRKVYKAVTQKDMIWFDTKMGAEDSVQSADGSEQGPLGAGGPHAQIHHVHSTPAISTHNIN
jgi:ATP-binding cassette, subfamily B (MDR/TAP), member 1